MDWEEAGKNDGPAPADKLGPGIHNCVILKVIADKKGPNGTRVALTSSKGDPQVGIVYMDDNGAQAVEFHTLHERAAWTLCRMLTRCGNDLKDLTKAGVTMPDFLKADVQAKYLIGRKIIVKVEEKDGGKIRVTPLHADEAQKERAANKPTKAKSTADDAEIPF